MQKSAPPSKGFAGNVVLALCFLIPALVFAWTSAHPSAGLAQALSLHGLPHKLHRHIQSLMFVPLGAVVVVFFRLTLGFRVLGLFRPILLAMAFRAAGIEASLIFMALALGVIVLVRPLLAGVHSYARLAVILVLIAALLICVLMTAQGSGEPALRQLAYFPVIALCLTCESFAVKMRRRGTGDALGRVAATAVTGMAIAAVSHIPGLLRTLAAHPETLIVEMGCVLAIDRWLKLRLLSGLARARRAPALSFLFAARAEEPLVESLD